MRRIEIMNPKPQLDNYAITVKVPCYKIVIMFEKNIYSMKRNFEEKEERAKYLRDKLNYKKCVCVLEWAISCRASIKKIANSWEEEVFEFTFSFENFERMTKFVNGFNENVNRKNIKQTE